MNLRRAVYVALFVSVTSIAYSACGGMGPEAGIEVSVDVLGAGDGKGRVTESEPDVEIDCTIIAGTTGNMCSSQFQDINGIGSFVLDANPDAGSVFGGWSGDCTATSGPCTLSFDVPISAGSVDFTVTATFDVGTGPGSVPTDLIVFESSRDLNREIYVIKPDGTGLARLTTNSGQDRDPVWSPDRTQIAFVSDRAPHIGNDEIYVMNPDGTSPVRLTTLAGSDRRPAYSPDGTKIAFDNDGDGDDEIFVMNANGTGVPTQLTFNSINFDQGPTWSPNSAQIVFTSFRDDRDNLYIMNADGTDQTLLVDTGSLAVRKDDYQPDWSPDGARIVFTSQDADGDDEIFVVNANGTGVPTQLTANTVPDREATWSSDSQWIAFTSLVQGNTDVFIMSADGLNVMTVTTNTANDSRPSWVH